MASLSAIAVLSAVSQAFVLTELSWQRDAMKSAVVSSHIRSLDRSLSLAALAIKAADDPAERRKQVESLRTLLNSRPDETPQVPAALPEDLRIPTFTGTFREAEPHLRAATDAAKALLARYDEKAAGPPDDGEIGPLMKSISAEEAALERVVTQALEDAERKSAADISRIQRLATALFMLVMVVLGLEGLFVISPAVKNIQSFMADMSRSNAEMKAYSARLERSNKELQDFASVASHDLQEPLRKVQAFSDRLKSKYAAIIDEQGRDYLDRIQNSARRMQTLINDLLTFSRVTTKAQPFVPVDLAAATHEVVSDLEVRIEQVKGRVEVGDMATLDADPLQVRQLMQNLIGNALKYHRADDPPVVKVSTKALAGVGHSTCLPGPHGLCQIIVEDNGIGFDEVYNDRIFTIFQRLHGRTEYEGTGVGLAVCRKIAERHGGTITARSTIGKGSTFLVTLPVKQQKEDQADGIAS